MQHPSSKFPYFSNMYSTSQNPFCGWAPQTKSTTVYTAASIPGPFKFYPIDRGSPSTLDCNVERDGMDHYCFATDPTSGGCTFTSIQGGGIPWYSSNVAPQWSTIDQWLPGQVLRDQQYVENVFISTFLRMLIDLFPQQIY